jgi:hypothetical protein
MSIATGATVVTLVRRPDGTPAGFARVPLPGIDSGLDRPETRARHVCPVLFHDGSQLQRREFLGDVMYPAARMEAGLMMSNRRRYHEVWEYVLRQAVNELAYALNGRGARFTWDEKLLGEPAPSPDGLVVLARLRVRQQYHARQAYRLRMCQNRPAHCEGESVLNC